MSEKDIEIQMKDGKCDAALYQADDGKKRPGVIHYPDIMGIRPSHRAMAKRLSEAGYTVVLVNPFYRTVKGACFDFTPNFGGRPAHLAAVWRAGGAVHFGGDGERCVSFR